MEQLYTALMCKRLLHTRICTSVSHTAQGSSMRFVGLHKHAHPPCRLLYNTLSTESDTWPRARDDLSLYQKPHNIYARRKMQHPLWTHNICIVCPQNSTYVTLCVFMCVCVFLFVCRMVDNMRRVCSLHMCDAVISAVFAETQHTASQRKPKMRILLENLPRPKTHLFEFLRGKRRMQCI